MFTHLLGEFRKKSENCGEIGEEFHAETQRRQRLGGGADRSLLLDTGSGSRVGGVGCEQVGGFGSTKEILMKILTDEFVNTHFHANTLPRARFGQPAPKQVLLGIESDDYLRQLLAEEVTVFGFDTYKYSELPEKKQVFIPVLLGAIRKDAWDLTVSNFGFLFQKYYSLETGQPDRVPNEIDTGDGGFVFFDSPVQAVCYLISISALLRLYNAHTFLPELRSHLGSVDIRYTITHGNVYTYKGKFYGSAIINNARILSRDKLNRLLVDKNVVEWFLRNLIGILSSTTKCND